MNQDFFYLCFLRHGQTPLNAEGKIIGLYDDSLNERGIIQAHEVASQLQKSCIEWKIIISSSLKRAVQTTSIIATRLAMSRRVSDRRFNERSVGVCQGKKSSPEWVKKFLTEEMPCEGAQPKSQFSACIRLAVADVIHSKQNTIIVTHSLPLVEVVEVITGEKMTELPPHTTPFIFKFTQAGEFVKIVEKASHEQCA